MTTVNMRRRREGGEVIILKVAKFFLSTCGKCICYHGLIKTVITVILCITSLVQSHFLFLSTDLDANVFRLYI